MASLIKGQTVRADYCALLRNLHDLYEALEQALLIVGASRYIAPFALPRLFRANHLVADLDALYMGDWRRECPKAANTKVYCERVLALPERQPELLIAHAYVRYLGDLHGGQILAARLRSSLNLEARSGTRFYEFGDAATVARLIDEFRATLDATPTSMVQDQEIVAEARAAFGAHVALFEELAIATKGRSGGDAIDRPRA